MVRRFERNSIIRPEDESKSQIYIMLSGIGRLTCLNRRGERVLMEVLGPGDMVGIPSLLPEIRQNLRCEASTECEIGRIAPKTLVEEVLGLPFEPFRHALRLTSGRWWQLLLRHSAFVGQTVQDRVVLALLELSSKLNPAKAGLNALNVDLTHQDLAQLVMASRAKVSGCLRRLAAANAITQDGRNRIVVVPERLQEIGGFERF
jgi:CRP/FNR family transcriptional regulator, cyclic AMP receptor protein